MPARALSSVIGKVGKDVTLEEAYGAARQIALFQMSVMRDMLGSLDRVKQAGLPLLAEKLFREGGAERAAGLQRGLQEILRGRLTVPDAMALLGPDMSRARVRHAIQVLGGVSKKAAKRLEKEYAAVTRDES